MTLLEALPVQETIEAIDELRAARAADRQRHRQPQHPRYLPADDLAKAAEGDVDADAVRAGLAKAGIELSDTDFAGLLTETIEHATRHRGARPRAPKHSTISTCHGSNCPPSPTESTLAACTNSPKHLPQQGVRMSDLHAARTPPRPGHGADPCRPTNRVVVCCGAGGVGKTTTAAAMALRAAEYGRTVVVLTIDPAKRLAQALGIKDLGNTPAAGAAGSRGAPASCTR